MTAVARRPGRGEAARYMGAGRQRPHLTRPQHRQGQARLRRYGVTWPFIITALVKCILTYISANRQGSSMLCAAVCCAEDLRILDTKAYLRRLDTPPQAHSRPLKPNYLIPAQGSTVKMP